MSFFTREDNKKLYESNLSEKLKNYIANFNEIIICYFIENFKDRDGFDEFLNKLKMEFREIDYVIDNNMSANAAFEHNPITNQKKFKINEDSLNMFSIENGLLGIYFHEFSHFISHMFKKFRTSRMEEGIADLLSDELIDYFNKKIAEKEVVEMKLSTYNVPAAIIRNTCLINDNVTDLLWPYYTYDKDKIHDFFERAYGLDEADYILNIEMCIDGSNYISKKEEKIIKNSLSNIDIEKMDKKYIRLNKLLQREICERLEGKTLEEVKKYNNFPIDFFESFGIIFQSINNERKKIVDSKVLDEDRVIALANNTLDFIKFREKENPNNKIGLYGDYTIDILLELINYTPVYKFEIDYLISYLYSYKLKYNNMQYDKEGLYNILKQMGFDNTLEEDNMRQIDDLARCVYDKFKDKSNSECFNELENVIKGQIVNSIKVNFYNKKLENKEMSQDEYINIMLEEYKKDNDTLSPRTVYLYSLIENYVKNIDFPLTLENFEKVKSKIGTFLERLDTRYLSDITARILVNWNIENVKIFDVVEILEKYPIDTTVRGDLFEDIRIKGILDIKENTDINDIMRYIKATTSDNFSKSYPFVYFNYNRGIYDVVTSLKFQKRLVKDRLESIEDSSLIRNLIDNDDRSYIYFYRYGSLESLSDKDIEILRKITGKDKNSNKFNDYISGYKFDSELYEKLKEYPHTAAIYIACFLPLDGLNCRISTIKSDLENFKKIDNNFLASEYGKRFFCAAKNLDADSYLIEDSEIKLFNIEQELKILLLEPYGFDNMEEEVEFIDKIISMIYRKLNVILESESDVKTRNILTDKIKKVLDATQNERIRKGLEEVLEMLNSMNIFSSNSK